MFVSEEGEDRPADAEGMIHSAGVRIHRDEIRGQNGMTAAALELANTKEQQDAARGQEHAALNVFDVKVTGGSSSQHH
jgi:hypothetical protein